MCDVPAANPIKLRRGKQVTQEGETGHKAFVLQQGWACSFKLLPNGSRHFLPHGRRHD